MQPEPTQKGKIVLPSRPKRSNYLNKYSEPIITNYYELNFLNKEKKFNQYEVEFDPEIPRDSRGVIQQVVKNVEGEIVQKVGPFVQKGTMIWACPKDGRSGESVSFKSKYADEANKTQSEYCVRLKKTKQFTLAKLYEDPKLAQQVLQVLNSQLKKKMSRLSGYKEFNKSSKFYNVNNEARVEDSNLKVMKGFFTSIHLINGEPKLLVDVSTRVLRNQSFADTLRKGKVDYSEYLDRSVIADYGNYRIYKVEEILNKITPLSTFSKNGQPITYRDYFKTHYGIEIKDMKQPMLKSSVKKKIYKDGKMVETQDTVYLVPELVKLTGMEDDERNNFQLMKRLAGHTKMEPQERNDRAQDLLQKLAKEKDKGDFFTVNSTEITVKGYVLPQPVFEFGGNKTEVPKGGQLNVRQRLLKPVELDSWSLAYTSLSDRDDDDADELVKILKDAGKTYGISVKDPRFIVSKNKSWESFRDALEKAHAKEPLDKEQMIITFITRFETGWYPKLKRELLAKYGANHQNVRRDTMKKNTMSIASKILLQINAKVGLPLWKIQTGHPEIKGKRIIIGGMAIYHKLIDKKKSCAAFVGTNNNDLTTYYSSSKLMEMNQQRFDNLRDMIINWVKSYCQTNKNVPEYIIVYREGVGEGSVQNILDLEVEVVKKAVVVIAEKMKIPNYSPGVAFILVNRKINQRLFSSKGKGGEVINPISGTVVGGEISNDNKFDFFLVPQYVNQGTATPCSFNVIYNTTNLSEDAFYSITNEQCYNYYNWQGAVRVPAPLMYADKLATLVGDHLKQTPTSEALCKTLYLL